VVVWFCPIERDAGGAERTLAGRVGVDLRVRHGGTGRLKPINAGLEVVYLSGAYDVCGGGVINQDAGVLIVAGRSIDGVAV
jgi:hypothetical protein